MKSTLTRALFEIEPLKKYFLKNNQPGSTKVAMVRHPLEEVSLVPTHRRLYTKDKQATVTNAKRKISCLTLSFFKK